ncbi:hypothetical protein QI229_03230 [Staphylococcus saprophyticus]|nr:hypothetical protein [Staphylococcus saprophyticus]
MITLKEICKDQRELLNECRQNIKELTEENKKLKEQIDTSQVSRLIAENEQLKEEKDKLEQENKEYSEIIYKLHKSYNETIDTLCESYNSLGERSKSLEHENKALRLQSNTYFDECQESEKQRNEFISYVNLYTTLTNHIRMKAENNPGVSRYIDLVNYIDRLECADDER